MIQNQGDSPERKLALKNGEKFYHPKLFPCRKDPEHQYRYTNNNVCVECTKIRSLKYQEKINPKKKKKIVEQRGEFYQPPIKVVVLPYQEPSLKERLRNLRFPNLSGKLE